MIVQNMLREKDSAAYRKATELCADGSHQLLYLTRHGSHLYGTNTPNSDVDYKGVFLPNLIDVIMGRNFHTLNFQSKDDTNAKNTSDDVDLQLFSVQFWLNKLVKKGETEGIELLYSHTNNDSVVYCDPIMMDVFVEKINLFDPRNTHGFLGFAISQVRKYFTKAERFNVMRDVRNFMMSCQEVDPEYFKTKRLSDVINDILARCSHDVYCFETNSNGIRAIQICGKVHQETIELSEFIERIDREYKKYGHRTKRSADLGNNDWKSLSHALKAIYEVSSLLRSGKIDFPLPERDLLRSIKMGEVDLEIVQKLIFDGVNTVERLMEDFDSRYWKYNPECVKIILLKMYKKFMINLVNLPR